MFLYMVSVGLSDAQVTGMHPIFGDIPESFKRLKEIVYDNVTKNYIIELSYAVSSSIIFMKCVNPKDSRGTDLGMIIYLRVEGIVDSFANTARDNEKIESIKL